MSSARKCLLWVVAAIAIACLVAWLTTGSQVLGPAGQASASRAASASDGTVAVSAGGDLVRREVAAESAQAGSAGCGIWVQDEYGAPIAGARLGTFELGAAGVSPNVTWRGESDVRGKFSLSADHLAGDVAVVADKPPFLSHARALGVDVTEATLVLRRRAGAVVTVTDGSGRPLEGVRVAASVQWPHESTSRQAAEWPRGLQSPGMAASVRTVETNAAGVAAMDDLAAGQHVFHASYPGHAIGGNVVNSCFVTLRAGVKADVRLVMLPIYCAIVDPGHHRIAKSIWSAEVQLAVPGLATVDIQRYESGIRQQFPGMLCYVYILPAGAVAGIDTQVDLRIMAMDGTWSRHAIKSYPVSEVSRHRFASLDGISERCVGGTLFIEGGDRFEGLGLSLASVESGESWTVGARSQFQLPAGRYRIDSGDQLLSRALSSEDCAEFRLEEGLEHKRKLELVRGYAVCRVAVVDELKRPVRNFLLRLRANPADEWTVWAGTLARAEHVWTVVREGDAHEMEVEAPGYNSVRRTLVPQRLDGAEGRCHDVVVMLAQ